ncbi:hypothetical protein [Microbacterium sp. 2MCAF23]|uniref:hypothetical protein n=1 Tax=Microbacterium sp. 2MCAF23 TaxID=3232985 RepID=UPI003F9442B8
MWIAADTTDSQATRAAGKVITMIERRTAMTPAKRAAQPPVTVWVGDGLERLAARPGQPVTPLQRAITDIMATGLDMGVTVKLVSEDGIVQIAAARGAA